MTAEQYRKHVGAVGPQSHFWKNLLTAYLVGGLICVIGQGFRALYESLALSEEQVAMAVSSTMVFLGALFTALSIYDKLARFAGAGTLVPITGFANAVVSPAMEFKSEGFVLGVGAKIFTIAGPVIVFGVIASVLYGILLVIFR